MTPEPPVDGERGPERDADESEAPTIEPELPPEPEPSETEPEDQPDREDKPGVDEYDEERLPPEPTDPSEGT